MEHKYPIISIITPSFNQGQFIEETIESVINQKYPNLEYIIIDGGSSDNTLDIIKKYEKHLYYWISESDSGQANAINKGLKKITGNIVSFLNSDDLYLPDTFRYVANSFLENHDCDFLCGQTDFIDEISQKTKGFTDLFNVELDDFTMTETCHIAQQSTFFRKSVLDNNNFFDEELNYCFDYEFWLRAYLNNYNFTTTSRILSYFRLHNDSKTNVEYRKGTFDNEFIKIYQRFLSKSGLTNEIRQGLKNGLAISACLLFVHLESTQGTRSARKRLFEIVIRNPEILTSKRLWKTMGVSLIPKLIRKIF